MSKNQHLTILEALMVGKPPSSILGDAPRVQLLRSTDSPGGRITLALQQGQATRGEIQERAQLSNTQARRALLDLIHERKVVYARGKFSLRERK